jgi:cysteine desulfurase / selenocysteine lyase
MIYLDNAATSYPKPESTITLLDRFVKDIGGNPGRSGHNLSLEAARIVFDAREQLTSFIGGRNSEQLIFTQNGTESLNLAILGLIGERDHVITTSMEHNSVMRPLTHLQKERSLEVSVVQASQEGMVDPKEFRKLVRRETMAVIVNHGSNVTGTVQPLHEIRKAVPEAIFIVDACQTIGSVPIDVEEMGIDILCFSGHKSLLGIQGTGAVYIRPDLELTPLKFGGTGSKSESIEPPMMLPDRYECGTPNTPGIAALLGGLSFIMETGMEAMTKRKKELKESILHGLTGIGGVQVYGNPGKSDSLAIISFNVKGRLPSEVGYTLNKEEIFVRVGLHCSPIAHRTIGTFPGGTVRVSPGYFTTDEEVNEFLEAIGKLAGK